METKKKNSLKVIIITIFVVAILFMGALLAGAQNPFSLDGWYKSVDDIEDYDSYLWIIGDMYTLTRHSDKGSLPIDIGELEAKDDKYTKGIEYELKTMLYEEASMTHYKYKRTIIFKTDSDDSRTAEIKFRKMILIPKSLR